jgi:hypothetical protein
MPKNAEFLIVKKCAFTTSRESNFYVHLLTRKHKILTNPNEKMPKKCG